MKKILSLFFVALFSVSMFATDYYLRGGYGNDDWGGASGITQQLTPSADGNYYYYTVPAGMTQSLKFKIYESATDWNATQYTSSNLVKGYNSTDISGDNGDGSMGADNDAVWLYNTTKCYILLYPTSDFNTTGSFIICASKYLPNENEITLYFVNDDNWTTVKAHVYINENNRDYKEWASDDAMTLTETIVYGKQVYRYTFKQTYNRIIFHDDNSHQTGNLEYDEEKPYYSKRQQNWFASAGVIPLYYITGNKALTGDDGDWNTKKFAATAVGYTFSDLPAGEYKLIVLPTGTWDDKKGYNELTDVTEGLTNDGSDNIHFVLNATADVIINYNEGTAYTVTTSGSFFTIDNGFYLFERGQAVYELDKKFALNTPSTTEYKLATSLTSGKEIKVVKVENNTISTGYPADVNTYYTVVDGKAGSVNIYFQETYKGDWSAFGGYFYIEKDSGTAIDEAVAGKKAVKRIVNGQLVIEREGKMYNALGAEVK